MIAKLEWSQSNAQQNIEQSQNLTMEVTINNESTTTEPPPQNGQQLATNFALDSAVVEAHNC